MNGLKKIQYNCRKATFLIEKKQSEPITIRERLELKIHLAGCSVCRVFEQQSILINKMVKDLFNPEHAHDLKLDEGFKKDLQEMIDEELNKN